MNALKRGLSRLTALRLLLVAVVGFSLPAFSADEAPGTGKWRVVNYWSEWCAPCRIEIPMLNALSLELAAHGVAVVGVNWTHWSQCKKHDCGKNDGAQTTVSFSLWATHHQLCRLRPL